MKFVRHPRRPAWGIGRVVGEGADRIEVHFEGVGLKQLARGVVALEVVPDEAVDADSPLRTLKRGRFPSDVTDPQLMAFIDGWVALLEKRDYAGAYAYTDHLPDQAWTPELLREVIESYGDARPNQRGTVEGTPTDVTQHKEVSRWAANARGEIGEIWYDLNIDGRVSDLTATFVLVRTVEGSVNVCLRDIHVM